MAISLPKELLEDVLEKRLKQHRIGKSKKQEVVQDIETT